MAKKIYLLDVSGFIFRAYFALPPMTNSQGRATHALFGFIRSLLKLFKEYAPTHVLAVFDGPDNKRKRKEIYADYKAHRKAIPDDLPLQIEMARQYCEYAGIATLEQEGVEADDMMGSVAHLAQTLGWDVYLCTSDKDLFQLVNDHVFILNPWKENALYDAAKVEEVMGVPPSQIIDLLAIMGDTSDNIPGVKGIGPKGAISLLQEWGSVENILENISRVKGAQKQKALEHNRELAQISKMLATINTSIPVEFPEDEFIKKEPHIPHLKAFYQEMGFKSLLKELDEKTEKLEPTCHHLVNDAPTLAALVKKLEAMHEVAFALNATTTHPLHARCIGMGFCLSKNETYYVPCNGALQKKVVLEALKGVFENPHLKLYTHNFKYALHVLQNEGIFLPLPVFDTLIASYLLHSETRHHTLDILAQEYLNITKMTLKSILGTGKKEISMADVPLDTACAYCSEDVALIFQLKQLLQHDLKTRKLDSLISLELSLSYVLMKMERKGIYLDTAYLKSFATQVHKDLETLKNEIYSLAGEEFNIASSQQLAHILFTKMGIAPLKKTKTSHSTAADVLEILAAEHTIAQKLLKYRTLDKLRSTYIDTLAAEVYPTSSRIHPTFNQTVTATGRLSCQDPNLQNIPIKTLEGRKIRTAFCPSKSNWYFLASDYSQIELRLLAHFSQDEELIHAFANGEDVHRRTASLILDKPYDAVSPHERNQAKAINFGIIYGQQAFGLSQQLGIDVKQAGMFIEAYFEKYKGVYEYVKKTIQNAEKTGKAVTLLGHERALPELVSKNAILRAQGARLAINTPLQGTASDLIKLAMIKIDGEISNRKLQSVMILQIHDELIFEVPIEELESMKVLVKEVMEGVVPLSVPLLVDVSVGKNWGEC